MAEYLDQLTQDTTEACAGNNRLENFLSALFELKYNISHIEKKYPFLGTELSSLCEDTISRLSRPCTSEMPPVVMEASLPLPVEAADIPFPMASAAEMPVSTLQAGPPVIERPMTAARTNNPVAYSLDAAGGILVSGLDKMGDGIILAFEKLLSLGPKGRKQPPAIELQ
jgi:hypothetical protein